MTLDSRGVGGSKYHTNQILEAIREITATMNSVVIYNPSSSALVSRFKETENDSCALTITDEDDRSISSLITNKEGTSSDEYELSGICEIIDRRMRIKTKEVMSRIRITIGYHHGQLQVLRTMWNFPKIHRKQLIDNWYVSNKKDNIPPLALL